MVEVASSCIQISFVLSELSQQNESKQVFQK